jgi:hypothetical protein
MLQSIAVSKIELAHHYDEESYRFLFKTLVERNKALELLDRRSLDLMVENLGYMVKLDNYSTYVPSA